MPRVSLIMTFHNSQSYLSQAIQSVLLQTMPDWQLVLVDDGSADASYALAEKAAKDDRRIVLLRQPHLGRVAALATGTAAADAPLLGWVDSDDQLHPEALQETATFLDTFTDHDLVFTNYVDIDAGGRELGLGHRCKWAFSKQALLHRFMSFHFRLFRHSLLRQIAPILTWQPFAEDYDFCLQASEVTLFGHIQRPLYRYRKHRQQLSATHRLQQIQATQTAIQRALERRHLADELEVDMELRGVYTIRRKQP